MGFISNTSADQEAMLKEIGVRSFEELLAPIPDEIRLNQPLQLPPALDESAMLRHLGRLASRNADLESHLCFLGAGIYDHFRPAVVSALASRGEFATAYTPYQPEVSQGMLQAVYEYQTLICALTGMDLSNASMYDAATALAEGALMAIAISDRPEVIVLDTVHPLYRQVIASYLASTGHRLKVLPWRSEGADPELLKTQISSETACVVFQNPDFYGCLEPIERIVEITHEAGALTVLSVDPIALGLLKPPGEFDVDIVVGEGQALGNPMAYGGPLLGFFACKKRFVRSFPGRIVGATMDQEGRRGYTMTLRTREQDIRREKATSNICTNQALLALCATIYLCELGKSGLRQVAELCLNKAHYAHDRLCELPGVQSLFPSRRFFKEFAVRLPVSPDAVNRRLLKEKIVGGLALGGYERDLEDAMLLCVTETKTRQDVDLLVETVAAAIQEMS